MAREDKRIYSEIGVTGLDATAGYVRADPDYKLQGQLGIEQYDLMRHTDPTVAAVLLALSLPVREAKWRVNPASSAGPDVEAAEFVESCMHDMSFSWDDFLTEVSTMFAFGWAFMEWQLKARQGPTPPKNGTPSIWTDGRIGFKKISLRGQASLHRWDLEEDTGKLNGMFQWSETKILNIPLSKAILFRTTKELNNPEGFSVLRPAHRPWQYKRNIERIEAIGLQRAMQGLPVMKLLQGATRAGTVATGESTEERALDIITRLYDNTMLGVIEDPEMEFRFESPDMRGVSQDSGAVIQRYDEAIARASLAMYILLGTRERGSFALARELGDLFFLAVEGFISMISQTFSKWGVPILFRYNTFPGITGYPEVTTAINRRVDLEVLANFINATVGSMVITPDPELERHIRELADLPAPAVEVAGKSVTPADGETAEETIGPPSEGGQEEEATRLEASRKTDADTFAIKSLSSYNSNTTRYQEDLRSGYEKWVEEAAQAIGRVRPEDARGLREKWVALVAAGLLAMKRRGWEALPEAFYLGYGSRALTPRARAELEAEIASNDKYLEEHLWAKIGGLVSPQALDDIAILFWSGRIAEAREMLSGILLSVRGNVGQYAGAYWRTIWAGAVVAEQERQEPQPGVLDEEDYDALAMAPIRWNMDALAQHCSTCLLFGDRDYLGVGDLLASTGGILPGQGTECDGNCRCWLSVERAGAWLLL